MKYQVGQRVKLAEELCGYAVGTEGLVELLLSSEHYEYGVRFDGRYPSLMVKEREIEAIEPEALEDTIEAGMAIMNASGHVVEPARSLPNTAVSGLILKEALDITQGARNVTHGAKERSFKAIAGLWNAYLSARQEGADAPITARNVSDLMQLLKIGRSVQGTPIRDHFVDGAGYAALSGELAELED